MLLRWCQLLLGGVQPGRSSKGYSACPNRLHNSSFLRQNGCMEANVQSSGRRASMKDTSCFVWLMPNFVANKVRQSVAAIESVANKSAGTVFRLVFQRSERGHCCINSPNSYKTSNGTAPIRQYLLIEGKILVGCWRYSKLVPYNSHCMTILQNSRK